MKYGLQLAIEPEKIEKLIKFSRKQKKLLFALRGKLTKKIVERVMEPGSNCGCSWLHCHKLTIWFVQGFTCFMEVSQVLEHFTDHLLLGADHQTHHIIPQGVPVLVQEALHIVPDLTSIVFDPKLQ